jgi:hypothetical protein
LLNSRPRKRLGWKTPYEVFYELTGVALECWMYQTIALLFLNIVLRFWYRVILVCESDFLVKFKTKKWRSK